MENKKAGNIHVRFASIDDNEKLLKIERESAQEGSIWLVAFREDFFGRLKYFEEGFIMIAENAYDIIGCIGVGIDNLIVNGEIKKAIYLFGLRTNPQYRLKVARWLKSIIQELQNLLGPTDFDFGYASVKADNTASKKILEHMGFSTTATLDFYACPVRKTSQEKSVFVEREVDLETILDLYKPLEKDHDLLLQGTKAFEVMVTERRLRLFKTEGAYALVLDTSGEQDFGITRLSKGLRAFQLLAQGTISPLVRIPKMNERLRSWDVLLFGWEDIRSARKIVRKIHRCAWEEGITLINFSRDRSLGSMKGAVGPLSFRIPFEIMIYEKNSINRGSRPIIRTPTI